MIPNFDRTMLEKAAREMFVPGLRNQLYDEMPLFRELMKAPGRAAGKSLIHDVVLYRPVATGIVAGYQPMVTQDQNLLQQAALAWSNVYYANISISWDEIQENSGAMGVEKLVELLGTKTEAAKMQLKENVYKDLYADKTTNGLGANTLVGLKAAILDTGTYAGINRGTTGNEAWKSNVFSTALTDDDMVDPTDRTKYLPEVLRRMIKKASHDGTVDIIITTDVIYGALEFIAERNNLRLMGNIQNLGFTKSEMGTNTTKNEEKIVKIYWDKYCPAMYAFGLNLNDWKSWVFPGADFEAVDVFGDGHIWQRGDKQLAGWMTVAWKGQLLCQVPRQQFVCTALGSGS